MNYFKFLILDRQKQISVKMTQAPTSSSNIAIIGK